MEKKDILRSLYEKKYLDQSPQSLNSLVAPQTSWAKVLNILWFKKQGEIYSEFENKNVTDIWWGLSSLVFELAPSVQKITIVDPIFSQDRKTIIAKEREKIEKRMKLYETLNAEVSDDILVKRKENQQHEQEVLEGVVKRQAYDEESDKKIVLNDSLAQHIEGIEKESQDVVFLNFVLDKLQGEDSLKKEILSAIKNAYTITRSGGKIYGVHDKGSSKDEIIDALYTTGYAFDGKYKDRYMYFIIEKE